MGCPPIKNFFKEKLEFLSMDGVTSKKEMHWHAFAPCTQDKESASAMHHAYLLHTEYLVQLHRSVYCK